MSSGGWEPDREIMSPQVVTVDPSATLTGPDAFMAHEAVFATAFRDARAELIKAVEAGDGLSRATYRVRP
jgi:CBS domain-containing protein